MVSEAVDLTVPVEITLVHKPRDTFNVGLGAATDTGARLRLKWERPWINTRGHSVTSELFLSSPEQSFTVDYRIPMQDITNDYLSIEGGYQFIDYSKKLVPTGCATARSSGPTDCAAAKSLVPIHWAPARSTGPTDGAAAEVFPRASACP